MIIPKEIKIGGHLYAVVLKSSPLDDEDNYCPAYLDDKAMEIVVDSRLGETARESSLFHEIFHGINSVMDHVLLDSLAEQFYQVLKDNDLLK